ncbi:MAG: AAA family ATPase, partial [Atopobiaceae bacterium]|nr:AAA family ATPase [Atopobiaceae bacterium]
RRGVNMINSRFIRSLSIDWDAVPRDSYLRGILALTRLSELEFTHDVTVFAGENGTGKSTLLEAIAVAYGFNREGGTLNFMHSSYDDVSELHEALTLVRGFSRPKWGQYLRAESLYNVATLVNTEYAGGHVSLPDLHAQSHGESFLSYLRYAPKRSLLILDEPEAALSPRRQIELAGLIEEYAAQGSQLIVATHSPIILGVAGAQVLSFDGGSVHEVSWRETDAVRVLRDYLAERLA